MTVTVHQGHVLDVLPTLRAASVHCCVTSPPYWGLRDYGTDPVAWPAVDYAPMPGLSAVSVPAMACSLGLEPDPWAFIGHLVAVFREVRRVLRDDGTCWVNLGDCYATTSTYAAPRTSNGEYGRVAAPRQPKPVTPNGVKAKDLLLMPARLALALQADGWWLRSDVIWHKRAPMPESTRDRPTSAHEHVFLLAKRERYAYDAEAVKPAAASDHDSGNGFARAHRLSMGGRGRDEQWTMAGAGGRSNLRNVWTLGPEPYPAAHFATFPSEIPRRCILAGTSEHGACGECGAPYVRDVRRCPTHYNGSRYGESAVVAAGGARSGGTRASTLGSSGGTQTAEYTTTGWRPTCTCATDERVPCTVLDPFGGAGTTGVVAAELGRRAVLVELSQAHVDDHITPRVDAATAQTRLAL